MSRRLEDLRLDEAMQGAMSETCAGFRVGSHIDEAVAAALDAVPDGYAKVDGQWRYVDPNHYVEMLAGGRFIIEHSLGSRFSDGGMGGCTDRFERQVAKQRLEPGRYRLPHGDGGTPEPMSPASPDDVEVD